MKSFLYKNKRLVIIILAVTALLMVPLISMQFSEEVAWTGSDFVFAGVMLFGTGLGFELAMRKTGNKAYRAAATFALITTLLLIWMNLAVGIIGNENNPLNLLFFGVILIGTIGSFMAGFKSAGMSRVMFTVSVAQALVPLIALIIGRPRMTSEEEIMGVAGVFILSWFFAVLFAGSGYLFHRANSTTAQEV